MARIISPAEILSIDKLIPHRGAMALVTSVLSLDKSKRQGTVQAILDQQNRPYWTASGDFAQHWLIEMMAQGAAAIAHAIKDEHAAQPSPGFLLTIRNWSLIHEYCFKVGDLILIEAQFEVEIGAISHCFLQAFTQGQLLAEANMTFLTQSAEQ